MMEKKLKVINSFVLSAVAVAVFIAVVTILAELYAPLKDWLKNSFSHHWTGKGILSAVIFAVFGILFYPLPVDGNKLRRNILILCWVSILSALAIFGFFIYHYF